jgi:UDP-N-acetylmuramoyl-tripeptide--D-alanyl-D-alanine ligase
LEKKLALKKRLTLSNTTMIAITGSAGKTTSCRFLYHILRLKHDVFLSAFLNTSRHIPNRICSIHKDTKYAIFEVSGHKPGAINDSCQYILPEIGIVTTVATDHFSNFRSMDNVALEKVNLVKNVKRTGLVFLNADDENVIKMQFSSNATVITFGQHPHADYVAKNIKTSPKGEIEFLCEHKAESASFCVSLTGVHFLTPILAGIACAHQLGMKLKEISVAAKSFSQTLGRCSIHRNDSGLLFVCDTIKSPFQTLPIALDVLNIFKDAPRRTLVIGTVSDKGGTTSKRYDPVTKNKRVPIDRIIFFGKTASHAKLNEHQLSSGSFLYCNTIQEVRDLLRSTQINGEVILLKGSTNVDKLERIAIDYNSKVTCWIDDCNLKNDCFSCGFLHK